MAGANAGTQQVSRDIQSAIRGTVNDGERKPMYLPTN